MSEPKVLSLGGQQSDDRPSVEVFGKPYKLRLITRSVQKSLEKVDRDLRAFMKDDDADSDSLVALLAGGLDALLAPDGAHRTSVKKIVTEKWEADEISLDELRRFSDELQEQAVAARPT